jgi:hypothetical protein
MAHVATQIRKTVAGFKTVPGSLDAQFGLTKAGLN